MEPMTPDEARRVLHESHLGVMALAHGARAYGLPLHYATDGRYIYFHSHHGDKDRFIDETREACLAVVRVESDDVWESVLAFGPVKRLTVVDEIRDAMHQMLTRPLPPQWGFSASGEPRRSGRDTYFWRMKIERLTGRKSVRPPADERDVTMA